MAVVRNLMVRAGADFSSMRKSMVKAQKDLDNFKRGVSKTMRGLGTVLAATGITLGIRSATKEAMQFEASLQQISRMMGDNAGVFNKWVNEQAAAFGMARAEATKYGAVFANLISGFTSGTAQTAQYTQDLLKAAAVISSSTGRTIEDTMDRIRSGMLGSTEAIEDLGINVNVAMIEATDAFKRFAGNKSWQKLDFHTQQTVRYFAILEQAATKYGITIAQNTTSRQAAFVAQLKNAQLALGQAFLPIYNAILPALTRMATALANVTNFIAQFTQALFGGNQQVKTTQAQADAVGAVGDAYEKAGKKAKGAVSSFDQVNLVGGTSAGGDVAGGGMIPTDTSGQTGALTGVTNAMDDVSAKAQEMAAKVKAAYGSMTQFIQQHSDLIIAALAGVGTAISVAFGVAKWGTIVNAVRTAGAAIVAALAAVSWVAVAIVAAIAGLVAAFVYFYRTNETFRNTVHTILQRIGDTAVWLWQNVLVPFGQWLATAFVAAWGAVQVAAVWLWDNVLKPFGQFLIWMWHNVLVPIASVLIDVLGVAFKLVADVAKIFWQQVLVPLGKALKEMFKPAVEAVSAVLTVLWQKVMEPLGKFIGNNLKVRFAELTKVLQFMWENVLKPLAAFMGGHFLNVLKTMFSAVGDRISSMRTMFIGLMDFITGVFTKDWEKAWNGVKNIFKGIFDSLYITVKTPLNLIIDAINTVISGLNKIQVDVPQWLGKIPGIPDDISSFGFNIPKIPKLARGGLAYGPTLAMVGDNRGAAADPEVIAPLSKLEGMVGSDNKDVVRMLERVELAVKDIKSIQAVISQSEIVRAAVEGIKNEVRRTGRAPFPV